MIRVFNSGVKQVTILHLAGWDNVAADTLSQNPTNGSLEGDKAVDESQVVTVKSIPPTIDKVLKSDPATAGCNISYNLSEELMKDNDVKMIKDYLVKSTLPEYKKSTRSIAAEVPSFCLIDGVLYYNDCRRGNIKRFVVPQALRNLIITENYCGSDISQVKRCIVRLSDIGTGNVCKKILYIYSGCRCDGFVYDRRWEQTRGSVSGLLHKMAYGVSSARPRRLN